MLRFIHREEEEQQKGKKEKPGLSRRLDSLD